MQVYLWELIEYRQDVPPADVAMKLIITGLFGKAETTERQLDKAKAKGLPVSEATSDEMQAYYDAGMPGPLDKWLAKNRGKT